MKGEPGPIKSMMERLCVKERKDATTAALTGKGENKLAEDFDVAVWILRLCPHGYLVHSGEVT